MNKVSKIYLNQHFKAIKIKQTYKKQWVKIIILGGLSQDVESNQSQGQMTSFERIFIALK